MPLDPGWVQDLLIALGLIIALVSAMFAIHLRGTARLARMDERQAVNMEADKQAWAHAHECLHRIDQRLDKHLPLIYSELRDTRERLIAQETLERERNR